jgi:DNA mismatch endonuclease, patch repair protein
MADNLTPDQRRLCMQAVKDRNTTPERIVRSALHRLGCRFALNRAGLPGRPDIVMPARRCVVLVHGCFWHGHTCAWGSRKPSTNARYWRMKIERNKQRDRRVLATLRHDGWRVLIVWECETTNPGRLSRRFTRALNIHQSPRGLADSATRR